MENALAPAPAEIQNYNLTVTPQRVAHLGAGIGLARVAQFVLGRIDIRNCVPFLINRDNAI